MTPTANGHTNRPRATDVDRQLGNWLRCRRIDRGLTQAQLAEMMGVTYQQLNKYERGINRLSAGRLLQVTAMLGVDLTDLAAAIETGGTATVPGPKMTSTARQVHERVARLTTGQQRSVLGMLEALAP